MQSLSFKLDLIIESSCSLTLHVTSCVMTFLMCQSHKLLPVLDAISLLTDTLCVLILLFPGKNKVMVIKHDIDTYALHLS